MRKIIALMLLAVNAHAGDINTVNQNQTSQVNANQTYQANQSNVGNSTQYNQKYSNDNSGNYTGNTWANTTTTVQQNINQSQQHNINNSVQSNYVDTSETDIRDSGNASSSAVSGSSSASVTSGDTTVKTGSTNVAYSSTYNQVRQHRVVPAMIMGATSSSYSQDNCNNSVSGQVGTGIFALGVSGSTKSSDCVRRRDATWWADRGQNQIACERMIFESPENAAAMKAAGLTCAMIAIAASDPVIIPSKLDVPSASTYDKWDRQNGIIIDKMLSARLHK